MELAEVDRYELDCRYGRAGVDRCYERAGIVLRGYDLKIFFREEGSRVGGQAGGQEQIIGRNSCGSIGSLAQRSQMAVYK